MPTTRRRAERGYAPHPDPIRRRGPVKGANVSVRSFCFGRRAASGYLYQDHPGQDRPTGGRGRTTSVHGGKEEQRPRPARAAQNRRGRSPLRIRARQKPLPARTPMTSRASRTAPMRSAMQTRSTGFPTSAGSTLIPENPLAAPAPSAAKDPRFVKNKN